MLSSSTLPLAPVYLDAPREPLGLARILVRVIGFCAGVIAVIAFCGAVADPPGGGIITAKVQAFRRTAGEYDTVFVGTSRAFRWFIPAEFDARLAERGVRSSSFNMGMPGASFYELHHAMRDCIAQGGNLKRVLFEYQELMPQIDPLNAYKPRMVYWHDAGETALAMETALRLGDRRSGGKAYVEDPRAAHTLPGVVFRRWPADLRIAYEHLKHGLTREFLVGRGKDVTRGLFGREKPELLAMLENRGYLSLEAELARLERQGVMPNQLTFRREKFLAEIDDYVALVEAMKGEAPVFGDTDWYNGELGFVQDVEIVQQVADGVRAAGLEFYLVIMPGNSRDRAFAQRLVDELDVPVLVYNAPERFPEFYDPHTHFDSGHPTADAARAFTQRLVADLLAAGLE
ncbi:MAG: hypothetical protein AB1726_02870 [Planctomycetota bacterium]